jgi:tRNA uridine 5-carboxymethylaminomethyl modification enzyme
MTPQTDFHLQEKHLGDDPITPFSFLSEKVWIDPKDQLPCHMTYSNETVRQIIKDNLHLNRHVTEEVTGPRYCPSIESKSSYE